MSDQTETTEREDSRTGVERIADERARHPDLGYAAEHDAAHGHEDALLLAARCYLTRWFERRPFGAPHRWPWAERFWKPSPTNRVRELEKAGALIAAEIDRLLAVRRQEADHG